MNIKISPKYGLNPTIPVCFWCGEERNEIALMGHIGDSRKHEDFEAPRHAVLDFEPCEKCRQFMELGFTLMEATPTPNKNTNVEMQDGVYPTGRYVVIKREKAAEIFGIEAVRGGKAFAEPEIFKTFAQLGG